LGERNAWKILKNTFPLPYEVRGGGNNRNRISLKREKAKNFKGSVQKRVLGQNNSGGKNRAWEFHPLGKSFSKKKSLKKEEGLEK